METDEKRPKGWLGEQLRYKTVMRSQNWYKILAALAQNGPMTFGRLSSRLQLSPISPYLLIFGRLGSGLRPDDKVTISWDHAVTQYIAPEEVIRDQILASWKYWKYTGLSLAREFLVAINSDGIVVINELDGVITETNNSGQYSKKNKTRPQITFYGFLVYLYLQDFTSKVDPFSEISQKDPNCEKARQLIERCNNMCPCANCQFPFFAERSELSKIFGSRIYDVLLAAIELVFIKRGIREGRRPPSIKVDIFEHESYRRVYIDAIFEYLSALDLLSSKEKLPPYTRAYLRQYLRISEEKLDEDAKIIQNLKTGLLKE